MFLPGLPHGGGGHIIILIYYYDCSFIYHPPVYAKYKKVKYYCTQWKTVINFNVFACLKIYNKYIEKKEKSDKVSSFVWYLGLWKIKSEITFTTEICKRRIQGSGKGYKNVKLHAIASFRV